MIKAFFGRWRDFLGKYVMHCHNVVHEDHGMMIRWDIVEPGLGDKGTAGRTLSEERILSNENRAHVENRPRESSATSDQNPVLRQQKQPTAAPPIPPEN